MKRGWSFKPRGGLHCNNHDYNAGSRSVFRICSAFDRCCITTEQSGCPSWIVLTHVGIRIELQTSGQSRAGLINPIFFNIAWMAGWVYHLPGEHMTPVPGKACKGSLMPWSTFCGFLAPMWMLFSHVPPKHRRRPHKAFRGSNIPCGCGLSALTRGGETNLH